MIFHSFSSQDERRAFGGSAFIELQFCKLPLGTRLKKIVSVRAITHWKDDSLYVFADDIDLFYQNYNSVFNCGIHNDLKSASLDICGINYYNPELIDSMLNKMLEKRPPDYETLADWLNEARALNGFYVLGI